MVRRFTLVVVYGEDDAALFIPFAIRVRGRFHYAGFWGNLESYVRCGYGADWIDGIN